MTKMVKKARMTQMARKVMMVKMAKMTTEVKVTMAYLFSLDIEKREDGEKDDYDDDHNDDHRLGVGRGGVHLEGRSLL